MRAIIGEPGELSCHCAIVYLGHAKRWSFMNQEAERSIYCCRVVGVMMLFLYHSYDKTFKGGSMTLIERIDQWHIRYMCIGFLFFFS